MNADAVDLNAMWSLDAANLALIAEALGRKEDAEKFRAEHAAINRRMNDLSMERGTGHLLFPAVEGTAAGRGTCRTRHSLRD